MGRLQAVFVGNIPENSTPSELIDLFRLGPLSTRGLVFQGEGSNQAYAILLITKTSDVDKMLSQSRSSQFVIRLLQVVDSSVKLQLWSSKSTTAQALGLNKALRWSCAARTFRPRAKLTPESSDPKPPKTSATEPQKLANEPADVSPGHSDLGYGDDGCLQLQLIGPAVLKENNSYPDNSKGSSGVEEASIKSEYQTAILWVTASEGAWSGKSLFDAFQKLGEPIVKALVYHHEKYSGPVLGLIELCTSDAAEKLWLKETVQLGTIEFRFAKSHTESIETAKRISKTVCSMYSAETTTSTSVVGVKSSSQEVGESCDLSKPENDLRSLAIRSSEYVLATVTGLFEGNEVLSGAGTRSHDCHSENKARKTPTVRIAADMKENQVKATADKKAVEHTISPLWSSSSGSDYLESCESLWDAPKATRTDSYYGLGSVGLVHRRVDMSQYISQQMDMGELIAPPSRTVIVDGIDSNAADCHQGLRKLVSRYGKVSKMDLLEVDNGMKRAYITYADSSKAVFAAKALHLIKFGGSLFTTQFA